MLRTDLKNANMSRVYVLCCNESSLDRFDSTATATMCALPSSHDTVMNISSEAAGAMLATSLGCQVNLISSRGVGLSGRVSAPGAYLNSTEKAKTLYWRFLVCSLYQSSLKGSLYIEAKQPGGLHLSAQDLFKPDLYTVALMAWIPWIMAWTSNWMNNRNHVFLPRGLMTRCAASNARCIYILCVVRARARAS